MRRASAGIGLFGLLSGLLCVSAALVQGTPAVIAQEAPARPAALVQQTPATLARGTIISGELGARMDRLVAAEAENGFSGSVLVAKHDRIFLLKGYGLADPETGTPNRGTTVFDLGSVTADFTLAAILRLEEMGRLRRTDRVYRFFPTAGNKSNILIEQLLRMESGLQEYHDELGDFEEMTRREALRLIFDQELLFEPGTEQAYSKSGFTLLAAIVERATGESFQDFIRSEFFEPAGMETASFYGDSVVSADRIAIGSEGVVTYGQRNAPQYWAEVSWALQGSGGMAGSPVDVYRWHRALAECHIFSCETLRDYWSYFPVESGELRYHGGGNDSGFVFVVVELIHENGLIILAQNNSSTGAEDPDFVRALIEAFTEFAGKD